MIAMIQQFINAASSYDGEHWFEWTTPDGKTFWICQSPSDNLFIRELLKRKRLYDHLIDSTTFVVETMKGKTPNHIVDHSITPLEFGLTFLRKDNIV